MRLTTQNASVLMQSSGERAHQKVGGRVGQVKPVPRATYAARPMGHFGMSAERAQGGSSRQPL